MIDDENVIISKNPAYTDQENEEYERDGTLPIVGVAATGNGVMTPDKLKRFSKRMMSEAGGGDNLKEISQRSKDLGFRQQEFETIKKAEDKGELSKPENKTNTAVEIKEQDMIKYSQPKEVDSVVLPESDKGDEGAKQPKKVKTKCKGEMMIDELNKRISDLEEKIKAIDALNFASRIMRIENEISVIKESVE